MSCSLSTNASAIEKHFGKHSALPPKEKSLDNQIKAHDTMTLVLQGAGALQQIQLGVNELAASLFVGKYVGSILTRKQDAKLFQVLEGEFDVKVKEVPAWLENVQLDRKFCILGEGLRRIEGKSSMKNVEMNTLEGLATFLVLCSRYSISDKAIVKLLEVYRWSWYHRSREIAG